MAPLNFGTETKINSLGIVIDSCLEALKTIFHAFSVRNTLISNMHPTGTLFEIITIFGIKKS